ncbi:CvpA family protein [Selenihalanaerobacter shriftii]|uniref:Membrane protein required for colicin V production n=1 Tax=Selenihalanaerobacter shriftii TaxID=142842 RepID=A0A1T4QMU1_9FIRM|nr:CvpA family protein [Selenihalanaerobacter shriftii]SKA04781.1 membrane protein required for colicin V production [Selenihalanaerobacter shriftii]
MSGINLLDFGIIVVLIISILRGYQIGLIRQVISIIALIIAFYIAATQYQLVSVYFTENVSLTKPIADVISFALITIAFSAVINIIGYLLSKLTGLLLLSMLDGLGGSIIGLAKGFLVVYILLILINRMPFATIEDSIQTSIFADKFLALTPVFEEQLQEFIN